MFYAIMEAHLANREEKIKLVKIQLSLMKCKNPINPKIWSLMNQEPMLQNFQSTVIRRNPSIKSWSAQNPQCANRQFIHKDATHQSMMMISQWWLQQETMNAQIVEVSTVKLANLISLLFTDLCLTKMGNITYILTIKPSNGTRRTCTEKSIVTVVVESSWNSNEFFIPFIYWNKFISINIHRLFVLSSIIIIQTQVFVLNSFFYSTVCQWFYFCS